MNSNLKVYDEKMNKSVDILAKDYAAIRAGRANPAVLDKVTVEYYGAPTPINQMAAVSVTEARTLTIQPLGPQHSEGDRKGDPDFGYRHQSPERRQCDPSGIPASH